MRALNSALRCRRFRLLILVLFQGDRPQKPAQFVNKPLAPFPGATSNQGICYGGRVKLTDIRDFYAQSANILKPWKVVEVEICPETQSIEVRVESEDVAVWTDPETCEMAHVHDWRERHWRHLDTCESREGYGSSRPAGRESSSI